MENFSLVISSLFPKFWEFFKLDMPVLGCTIGQFFLGFFVVAFSLKIIPMLFGHAPNISGVFRSGSNIRTHDSNSDSHSSSSLF